MTKYINVLHTTINSRWVKELTVKKMKPFKKQWKVNIHAFSEKDFTENNHQKNNQ